MRVAALFDLALHLAVGRLCLSLLPAGWPGYHNRREVGATLLASLLLGTLALQLVASPWIWGAVLLVRWALLPGALRPRHEIGRGTGLPWDGAFAALALWWVFSAGDVRWPVSVLGALWLVLGISTWSRRADRRARALAVCGLLTPLVLVLA